MPGETNTSAEVSATQQPSTSPAMGTPATDGATPQKPTLTLEEAMKRLAEFEQSQTNAKEEVERHRRKLTAYEKAEREAEAAKKAADDAQLSEIERIKKQYAALEQKNKQYQQQLATERLTSTLIAHGVVDAELATLAIQSLLEYDGDGMPSNVSDAIKMLAKNKPILFANPVASPPPAEPAHPTTPPPTPTRQPAPTLPSANPGRSTMTAPGTPLPGTFTPPSWGDAFQSPK